MRSPAYWLFSSLCFLFAACFSRRPCLSKQLWDRLRNRYRSHRCGCSRSDSQITNHVSGYTRTGDHDASGQFRFYNVPFNPYRVYVLRQRDSSASTKGDRHHDHRAHCPSGTAHCGRKRPPP